MFSLNYNSFNPLWDNGPSPGGLYNFHGFQRNNLEIFGQNGFETQRTLQSKSTGTSVVGIKFDGGVMISADNLISYGSLARYQDIQRVYTLNKNTIIGAGGDYADFQYLKKYIDQKIVEDICYDDNISIKPKSLFNWITRSLYNKRSRLEPLWIEVVVGGLQDGEPFLGHIDLRGRAYQDIVIDTGFSKHLAIPLLRELEAKELINEEDALGLLKKCMEVLYYRDCRALSEYSVAICTKDNTVVQGPVAVGQNWQLSRSVEGY